LRELSEIGQRERLAVWLRQLANQRRKAAGEFLPGPVPVILAGVAARVDASDQVVRLDGCLPRARARSVVVDDGVTCDAIGERVEPILNSDLTHAPVKAQQDLLGDVVRGVRVADPPPDESAQTLVQIRPEHVRRDVGCGH